MKDPNGDQIATASYWDHQSSIENRHEWFMSADGLEHIFQSHLFSVRDETSRILHLGSGHSSVPYDLARRGYRNQLCVDFSTKTIEYMLSHAPSDSGVDWKFADICDMGSVVPDESIDVAFDKGAIDSMIYGSPWDPPQAVRENTGRYLDEVFRVLKDDGVFLLISFRQPHFLKPLVNSTNKWNLSLETLQDGKSSFDYYALVMRKPQET